MPVRAEGCGGTGLRPSRGRRGFRHSGTSLLLLAAVLAAPPAASHALLHRVLEADAMVRAEFYFPDGDRPYFESYRVMAPDDHRPFQTGRVNAAGEVTFQPDRPGPWRVIVATEDGHGTELRITVDADGIASGTQGLVGLSRWERLTAGVGYLLGMFGLLALWRMHRARRQPV